MTTLRTVTFDNGVVVEFVDRSNRYFGDYHRVCVEARISASGVDRQVPQRTVRLERMGVPGCEVTATCHRLADDFIAAASRYLAQPDYPVRLAAAATKPALSRRTGHSGKHAH